MPGARRPYDCNSSARLSLAAGRRRCLFAVGGAARSRKIRHGALLVVVRVPVARARQLRLRRTRPFACRWLTFFVAVDVSFAPVSLRHLFVVRASRPVNGAFFADNVRGHWLTTVVFVVAVRGNRPPTKMASRIRCLVSKNKRRFQEDGFDLDLSYIRPNIIAMGFPAERLEGVFRNHIDDVVRFMETKHKDHYKIYNLCNERFYNIQRFNNRVAEYPFVDHQPPSLEVMLPFCEDVHKWLSQDDKNVVAVHCKAGKGRTGVMICAYLLYTGEFSSAKDALEYYGKQRTIDMNGVTIPSQIRYVNYFAILLQHDLPYRLVPMKLCSIELEFLPGVEKSIFNPQFVVSSRRTAFKWNPCLTKQNGDRLVMALPTPCVVAGDVRVEFFHRIRRLHKERLFHFWFNTFFARMEGRRFQSAPPSGSDRNAASELESRGRDGDRAVAVYESTFGLSDLDQLKAKSQKYFNENFKICMFLVDAEAEKSPEAHASQWRRRSRTKVPNTNDQSSVDGHQACSDKYSGRSLDDHAKSPFHIDNMQMGMRTTPTSVSV